MNDRPHLKILPATVKDLEWMAHLAQESFILPWTPAVFRFELESVRTLALKACLDGFPAGFAILHPGVDAWELLYLAVNPRLRRKGVGWALILASWEHILPRGPHCITLEVSERNTSAIALYKKFGFCTVGRRPNYYPEEQADALLLDFRP